MSFGLTDPPIQQLRENMYNVTNKIDRENGLLPSISCETIKYDT